MFWVISVYFNIRNTLPKFCPFLLGHPVYDLSSLRVNDGKVDECSSVECIFFDDVTQTVPTEHMQLETFTLKIEMNQETDMY